MGVKFPNPITFRQPFNSNFLAHSLLRIISNTNLQQMKIFAKMIKM